MNKILPFLILLLFLFNTAYSGKKDIQKIKEAYKRMMESAHPTPDLFLNFRKFHVCNRENICQYF